MKIIIRKQAEKELKSIPSHILDKLRIWLELVEEEGLKKARKINAFNDKSLKGKRKNQHSVRLSRAYRMFYLEYSLNFEKVIEILEVNKYDY